MFLFLRSEHKIKVLPHGIIAITGIIASTGIIAITGIIASTTRELRMSREACFAILERGIMLVVRMAQKRDFLEDKFCDVNIALFKIDNVPVQGSVVIEMLARASWIDSLNLAICAKGMRM